MSKHTPGPWSITPFDNYDKDIWIEPPSIRVDHDDIDLKESEANALLIAAAPDLLEALKNMYAQAKPFQSVEDEVWKVCEKQALTAIAKAEGTNDRD